MILQEKKNYKLKIAYIPYEVYGNNLTYDRRNILLYGKLKNIKLYKFNKKKIYDYIILPPSFDITDIKFIESRKEFIVSQLIDNYLGEKNFIKNTFRGLFKYILGSNSKITLNYKKQLKIFLSKVDLVLCASDNQLINIKKINPNVVKIFEGNFNLFSDVKKDYRIKKKAIISWEGRAENIRYLNNFYNIFKFIEKKVDFYFFIFSDFYWSSLDGKFIKFNILNTIKIIFKDLFSMNTTFAESKVYFYQWNYITTPKLLIDSDLFIIPAGTSNDFLSGRSPNKLLMAMRMGIPVLTSNIESYKSLSGDSKVDFCCSNINEWKIKILKYLKNEKLRKNCADKLKKFVNKNYSKKRFISIYDKIFFYNNK
jgi:glycosyltransferase involved in cell wall biosynthesis